MLYKKKEFAKLCGMETNALAVYIKRKKITLSGDYIDDSIEQNIDFLKKKQEKLGIKHETKPEKPTRNINSEYKVPEIPVSSIPNIDDPATGSGLHGLDKQKKALDIKKVSEEVQLLQIKKEKLQGILIPTDLVKDIIAQLSKSFISSFKDASDNFLIEISKRKTLSSTEFAELKGLLVKIINENSLKAITESKRNMKTIVSVYSEKKEVGEHE